MQEADEEEEEEEGLNYILNCEETGEGKMSKNKLQEFAQRNYRSLPIYNSTKEGPDHAPRFRASVTYDGHTYHSPAFFTSVKQAETAAAEAALHALNLTSNHNFNLTNGSVIVQMDPVEVPSNLQKESNKEQKGDKKEETLQQSEVMLPISESGMANVLENGELKAETSKIAQVPLSFPSSRIQVVSLRGYSASANSGKRTEKQNTGNIISIPQISGNETNKEQAIQQSEGKISTSQFMSDMHKNQLQDFAIRGGFDLPCYSSIREGLPHVPRFKAAVKFNGETFESPGFFNTLRQAEHAAATVALKSLSEKGSSLDESSMYKSLLQEKAQKEGKPSPTYNTTRSGPSHIPVFKCTVKFDGMTFEGTNAKTKKQAEKNAASTLWSALKDSRRSSVSTPQMHNDKAKALVCEPNDHERVQVISHMKEEITRQCHGQLCHLDLSTSVSAVSLSAPSEAFDMGSKEELVHNITACVLGNRDKDEVQQPCNRSSPTKHSSGTRIRVQPGLSSSSKPWVAMNLTASNKQFQNNTPDH
ncbi:hypothetical protein KI387_017037 [Taxus chinensis]|uniref:DRBM domain-containing protein n=1 Tax=Taxus chinensis TaxID=29808 RepID=A0AA38LEZ6_TAXCH|nr:hypothetical protein KI387_017037 [Taxus chinensis]